ncbi:MAG: toll/interleukin-1 receptor domain-containing protein [Candidatus Brocadia sp.]|jgi:NB-ARC domain.|nr:MAG: toll/interleukin-1 receptor domain-containing protein [Candidatus Brocadia sp.]
MEYDIFFSYPHKDAKEVQHILQALQAEGLNVWIDKSEIRDYESITRSIVGGLAHAKVLLAYYSLNYWRSRACQWELTAGFLAAQREGDARRRILVINPEEKAGHIHPVELRDELFQKAPADAEALRKLVQSVKAHVSGIKNTIGAIYALTQPRWYGRKGAGSNRFVGRLPDMWRIHSALHSSGVPVITGAVASAVVQVQGMGGVGKSLLAEEYALRYAAAFPGGVFWLRALGNDDTKTAMGEEREAEHIRQISDFAVSFGIFVKDRSPEEIEAGLARELERRGLPYLWIADDVPSGMEREALHKWLAPHPSGKTLITTRTREYNALGTLIPLGVLAPEEAYELLTLRRKPAGKTEEDAARMLTEDLGYHALAVDVAGALLDAKKGLESFAEFRKKLVDTQRDELEYASKLKEILPTGHEKSIASTLLRSIRQLEPEGLDFLRLASVLAVAPIPASLVSAVFSKADNLDEEAGKHRAMFAFDQVENLSLAEGSDEESGAKTVHTLVSRTVRFHETMPDRIDLIQAAAVSVLTDGLSVIADGRIHSELKLEVAHARQLVNRGDDIPTANITGWLAGYDHLYGAYRSAEMLLRRELDIRNRILGDVHPHTLRTMNNIAETLRAQGDLASAHKLNEQVLEIKRKILGDEHPDTLMTMNNLAEMLSDQGDLAVARKLEEQVLEKRRRILGDEHPDTSLSAWNLVVTLLHIGDAAEAMEILSKHLLWLLSRDPATLEANQQKIREMIIESIPKK